MQGGSSRRTVTGWPCIALNSPSKSLRCIGSNLASATRRPASSSARIISRTALMRSPSKNMCSVRQRPIPSAPNIKACAASFGVSALARTFSTEYLRASSMSCPEVAAQIGGLCRYLPQVHLACRTVERNPVALLDFISVYADRTCLVVDLQLACTRYATLAHAARYDRGVEVMPPRAVRMPAASSMPFRSSGEVSMRTRIARWFSL